MVNLLDPEYQEVAQALNDALSRIESDTSTFCDYLLVLSLTPTRIFSYYMWEPTTEDEKHFVELIDKEYLALAMWMKYLVPGDQPMSPELTLTDAVKMKPRASFSKSILDIAAELLPRFPELYTSKGAATTPADVWLAAEVQYCRSSLWMSGLLTGKPTHTLSKEEAYELYEHFFRSLGGDSQRRKPLKDAPYSAPLAEEERAPALSLIRELANKTADQDPAFKYCNAFNNFREEVRKLGIRMRHDSDCVLMQFENGLLIPPGRKAPRKQRKIKKAM